jgi:uncharacterized membrane protein HdeD (DUF308 family)
MDDDTQRPPEHWTPEPLPEEEEIVLRERVTISSSEMRDIDRRASWAASHWSTLLALGVVAVIFGIIVLANMAGSLTALIWLTGLFLIFIGIVQIVTPAHGEPRTTRIAGGAIAVVGGVVCLAWPGSTLTALAIIAGLTFLFWGIVRTYAAFTHRRPDHGWDIAVGIGLLILGIVMMVWPGATITVIGLIVGLTALIWGFVTIGNALHLTITVIGVIVGLMALIWGFVTIAKALHLRAVARHWERVKARAHRA